MYLIRLQTIAPMHVFTSNAYVPSTYTPFANVGFFENVEYSLGGCGPPRNPGGAPTLQKVFNVFEETTVCESCRIPEYVEYLYF